MAEIVTMPKMSDTMEEGVVAKWHKKIGDTVKSGDLVAEIETDKATMEFESYQEGVVLYLGVKEGAAAPVDGILAIFGEKGEDYKPLLEKFEKENAAKAKEVVAEAPPAPAPKAAAPAPAPKAPAPVVAEAVPVTTSDNGNGRIKASPLAKKLAADKGIDLGRIQGSGEGGRVVKRDIDWYKPSSFVSGGSGGFSPAVTKEGFEEVAISQMRKTIAKRLSESKFTAPHFYLTMSIEMDKMMEAREVINQVASVKISYNDIIMKATAMALRENPQVNSSWLNDRIRTNKHVHIGMAVGVEDGLLVPVIRFTDSKTLSQIATESKDFVKKVKEKKIQPEDWEGNTFTISNLGMFDIDEFTAIINTPDSCILAVGGINETAIAKDGEIYTGHIMKVTLSCDHRVVDGVVGSKFLNTLKTLLENPVIMLGQSSI